MINIIDHAWQFELKDYRILPTVIKFANNLPKSYFYSVKNNRILRKKDQSLQVSLQFLKNCQHPYQNYLLVTQSIKGKIQFSFILQSQLFDLLTNESLNCAIIQLEQIEDKTLIIQCSFDLKGKVVVECLMQFDKAQYFWSSSPKIQIATSKLQSYMLKLWKQLPQIMKIQSKCQKIELMLSVSPSLERIYILWCNQFSFSTQQFYQIRYDYTIKSMSFDIIPQKNKKIQQIPIIVPTFQTQKTKFQSQKTQIYMKQSNNGSKWLENIQNVLAVQKKENDAICKACGCQFEQQKGKQVCNSDVIALRRRKRLSIMGILAEYLLICQQCYYQIDNE